MDEKKETGQYNFKTQDICKKDSYQLENIPDHFKTQSMCERVVKKAS